MKARHRTRGNAIRQITEMPRRFRQNAGRLAVQLTYQPRYTANVNSGPVGWRACSFDRHPAGAADLSNLREANSTYAFIIARRLSAPSCWF
jgi:hypothetical protein